MGTHAHTDSLKDEFIERYTKIGVAQHVCDEMGISLDRFSNWRDRDPVFLRRYNDAKERHKLRKQVIAAKDNIYDPDRPVPPKGGFVDWRLRYLGRPTWPHQIHRVAAMEDETNLVVLVLQPPGSGKDTDAGDFVAHYSCDGRNRVAWIMSAEKFSVRRMNERLGPYLTDKRVYEHAPDGPNTQVPKRNLIDDYGPFRWNKDLRYPDGTAVPRFRWTAEEKFFVSSKAPESDPNIWATGIQGKLYGSRVDLMVISDPFDSENQRSPTIRAAQLDWLRGTVKSRLDEKGRLIIIGTRVASYDNYGALLEDYTRGARVVWQSDDGYYVKYSNGTATVISPAVTHDDQGEEVSYWPERFPMHGQMIDRDGEVHLVNDLDNASYMELVEKGSTRIRGLSEIREESPETFQTLYQQSPPEGGTPDFTQALLDHCDDTERTLGVALPGEILLQGTDPARVYGAAYVVWGYDRENDVGTVVDFFFGERLGRQGIKDKLIIDPVSRWLPRYFCYEVNREEGVLDHPDIQDLLRDYAIELVRHQTNLNRSSMEMGVAAMADWMRSGRIRFPAATSEDVRKMRILKQHFLNWDRRSMEQGRSRPGASAHEPDDGCMAAWVGWVKMREIGKRVRRKVGKRMVPLSVQRRWGRSGVEDRTRLPAPDTDLIRTFMGHASDDD